MAQKETPAKRVAPRSAASATRAKTAKSESKAVADSKVDRPYPRRTLEEAARVVTALKEQNGGNPWSPNDLAVALGFASHKSNPFFYQAAASRDFGFTLGGRDSKQIELTDLGRRYAYAPNDKAEVEALKAAFLAIPTFKGVLEYYKGPGLPEKKFLSNTLESEFKLSPDVHDEFIDLFKKNAQYLGLEKAYVPARELGTGEAPQSRGERPDVITIDEPEGASDDRPHCFVIMPFAEKTDRYRSGFFSEVLRSIIGPAGKKAGFTVTTANREGSDVIQSTIVNRLLDDALVIADLTEHNPNVLFELGMRMAFDKPVVLIKAKGTSAIFDVDNMLRVFEYDPSLWPSTVEVDVPNLAQFIRATWSNRASENTYLRILKRAPASEAEVI